MSDASSSSSCDSEHAHANRWEVLSLEDGDDNDDKDVKVHDKPKESNLGEESLEQRIQELPQLLHTMRQDEAVVYLRTYHPDGQEEPCVQWNQMRNRLLEWHEANKKHVEVADLAWKKWQNLCCADWPTTDDLITEKIWKLLVDERQIHVERLHQTVKEFEKTLKQIQSKMALKDALLCRVVQPLEKYVSNESILYVTSLKDAKEDLAKATAILDALKSPDRAKMAAMYRQTMKVYYDHRDEGRWIKNMIKEFIVQVLLTQYGNASKDAIRDANIRHSRNLSQDALFKHKLAADVYQRPCAYCYISSEDVKFDDVLEYDVSADKPAGKVACHGYNGCDWYHRAAKSNLTMASRQGDIIERLKAMDFSKIKSL